MQLRMSALGQKQTSALHNVVSALPPIATAKADMPQMVMSALPPKADMCGANRDVRLTPNSGHSLLSLKCPLSANSGHWKS